MTEDDKALALGTALIAHKQISEEISALRVKLDQVGEIYSQIGAGLKKSPEGVYPRREGIDTRFASHGTPVNPDGFPGISDIFALTEKIRKALIRQQELATQLAGFR